MLECIASWSCMSLAWLSRIPRAADHGRLGHERGLAHLPPGGRPVLRGAQARPAGAAAQVRATLQCAIFDHQALRAVSLARHEVLFDHPINYQHQGRA